MTRISCLVKRWLMLVLFLAGASANAAEYPDRPIRWILGFPGGGTSDILARAIAEKLTEAWGQQIVIDNRPGASGVIANELAARASPDGYTMLMMSSTYANLVAMGKKLPYDPEKDLVPVSQLASVPNILVVHPSVPVKSVRELIDFAKAKQGQVNYGTGGTGTGPHLATELFKIMTGVDIMHIPYKGTPPAVNDLLGGRVQVMFALSPVSMPHVKAGKLRPLAVSGKKRLSELPAVPTVAETVPGYEATTWYGLMVPAGTPVSVVNKLNKEIGRVLANSVIKERLATVGFETEPGTPQEFTKYMRSEIAKWGKVIRQAKIEF
jgi:tripartite-type tricarboxylate transporter receptor subunit TctC